MKNFTKLFASVLFSALAVVSCVNKEETKSTAPAELKSFKLLKADNPSLSEDISVESISAEMIIRVKDGGAGKTFVASLTAGEDDVIKVNDKAIGEDGKASFDATFPVDIVVTNTKSELKASYVVKIGKILEIVAVPNATYLETGATLGSNLFVAANAKDGNAYMMYDRTVGEESNKNVSVVKWNGSAFETVTSGIADNSTRSVVPKTLAFDKDGAAYLFHYGEKTAYIPGVKKFNGTTWAPLGKQEIGSKITTTYGYPELLFDGTKVIAVTTGNNGKTDPGYRNAVVFTYDGTDWTETAKITGLPAYGEKGGNDGMFYRGVAVASGDASYLVTSCNLYGYYMFKVKDGVFTKVVDNFIPEGETYGVPSNLSAFTGADGKIYVFAAHSANHQMQIYRYNDKDATFDKFADPLEFTAGNSGAIAESASCFALPTGEFVVVKIGNDDKKPYYTVLDENRQWSAWTVVATPNPCAGDMSAAMTPNGTIFVAYKSTVEKVGYIESFTIGYEADILPE